MLRTRAYIGQHMPLYCSAMGKIYMAFGQPDYVASYWESHKYQIQPLTLNTITDLPAMYDELRKFVKPAWRWIAKKMNWASPVLLCLCLIFTIGCLTPFLFHCRRHG